MELLKNPYFISFASAFILVTVVYSYQKITGKKSEKMDMGNYVKLFFASGFVNSLLHFFSSGVPLSLPKPREKEQVGGSVKEAEMGSKKIHTDEPDWD